MEAKIIATQTSPSLSLKQSEIENFPKLDAILPIVMIFGICATIAVLTSANIFRGWQREHSLKTRDRAICDGCKYFNNNNYLKCALQPKTVMTEQSIDCRDYSPVHKVKKIEKANKVLLAVRKVFRIS